MTPEENLAIKVQARVLEYLQNHVSKTISLDCVRVFLFVALAGGSCPLRDAATLSGKTNSTKYITVNRLQASYEQNGKTYRGHNLVVIRESPVDARTSEVTLSEPGKLVVKALADVFTNTMAGRPMLRKGAG